MSIAVVKPDHFGDLILSSAAIRALASHFPDLTLHVAPQMIPLARFLFPELALASIELPHLQKSDSANLRAPDLRPFDHVVFLRNDGVINSAWAKIRCRSFSINDDASDQHQSALDYKTVSALIGDYNIDEYHFGDTLGWLVARAANPPHKVGFSIGSGFHANSWPVTRWVELGSRLLRAGCAIRCIGGEAERETINFIHSRLGLDRRTALIGSSDFSGFLSEVADLDLVIASDGGTAHLCALATPVLSVFGPSPYRRFSPYGRWNRLLIRPMPCAPCYQFDKKVINCCVTTECISAITAPVVASIALNANGVGDIPGLSAILPCGDHLYTGLSHACNGRNS